jgi:hypothetical protein
METTDFLTIGKNKIVVRLEDLNQADLNFYPENPRVYSALNSDGSVPSQSDIEEHMKKLDHVRDLADDIERNGGLMEEIIVRDGDFVVLEGNSRLAAYRLLCEKDPIKWGKIKCKVLPQDIDEDLIFRLIGQFHIKGKKPWDPYEQASYLYRRSQESKTPISVIAEELGVSTSDANKMIDAISLMKSHSEIDNRKYSYYYEYAKDVSIKKYRDTSSKLDDTICEEIKRGDIEVATDIRKLSAVAKVSDKQSKKLMEKVSSGETTLYEAYETLDDYGKLDTSVTKLKKFKNYVNADSFEKNVRSSPDLYKQDRFEIDKIVRRLTQLQKKWNKEDE